MEGGYHKFKRAYIAITISCSQVWNTSSPPRVARHAALTDVQIFSDFITSSVTREQYTHSMFWRKPSTNTDKTCKKGDEHANVEAGQL